MCNNRTASGDVLLLMPLLPKDPPPGPSDPTFWHSPLRGPWLTAFLGTLLLGALLVIAGTGFLSHLAYGPDLGSNAIVPRGGTWDWLLFDWPAVPLDFSAVLVAIVSLLGVEWLTRKVLKLA